MIHPLLKMLATRPELMAEHLGAYADLAAAEASEAASDWRSRALLLGGTGALALLAVIFGGISLLLLGALPRDAMPAPWLLALVPAAFAVAALGCWMTLKGRPSSPPFRQLRQQVAVDAALVQEAGQA